MSCLCKPASLYLKYWITKRKTFIARCHGLLLAATISWLAIKMSMLDDTWGTLCAQTFTLNCTAWALSLGCSSLLLDCVFPVVKPPHLRGHTVLRGLLMAIHLQWRVNTTKLWLPTSLLPSWWKGQYVSPSNTFNHSLFFSLVLHLALII